MAANSIHFKLQLTMVKRLLEDTVVKDSVQNSILSWYTVIRIESSNLGPYNKEPSHSSMHWCFKIFTFFEKLIFVKLKFLKQKIHKKKHI